MPFEYFELALAIWDAMEEYDTFAYLDSRDYWESVWTNLEVAGWRFLSSPPTAVRVTVGRNGGYSADEVSLPAMSRAEMNSWTEIRRNLRPYALQTASRDSIYRGGKLSRKRYLLPCLACRQYSLIRKRTIEDAAKSNDIVNCARCGTSYRIASEGKYSKIRSRTPIVAKPLSRSSNDEPRALTVEELIHLYTRENPPQGITDAGD